MQVNLEVFPKDTAKLTQTVQKLGKQELQEESLKCGQSKNNSAIFAKTLGVQRVTSFPNS